VVLAGLGCSYKTTYWCSIAFASSVAIYMYCFVFVDALQFGRIFRRARSFNLLTDGVRGVLADPAAWQASAVLPAAIAAAAEEEEEDWLVTAASQGEGGGGRRELCSHCEW
jgi:hypothetical protein